MSLTLVMAATAAANPVMDEPALVPRPANLDLQRGRFKLGDEIPLRIAVDDTEARDIGELLAQRVERVCGRRLVLEDLRRRRAGGVRFGRMRSAASASTESYRLRVGGRRIVLEAGHAAGLRHGATTLLQLICAPGAESVPAMRIDDAPAFSWRGVMLDSARHYQSPEYIRRFLDAMALHKLNVLHWHLTDDQAWRLEILKYPKLTEVGAWRVPAGDAALADIDPATGRPRLHGGFYSQVTVREIVAYAVRLGITIVPEIEMPGHASAALAAYPQFGAAPGTVTGVPSDWGIYANAFALDEPTFEFLEDVLRETMALFPSRHIHVGGDEVGAGQWQASAPGKALARKLGRDDGHALQAWFTERIGRFLEDNGRRLVGWDEILSPGLAQDAVVMSWRGIDGALQAAAQGHDTVLSPWPTLYFDNRQSTAVDEPPGRVRLLSLRDVYAFDPLPPSLNATQRRHVLGLQGNVWTEHIRTEPRVDHMTFPRAAAIAELGWTPPTRREWNSFARRLAQQFEHYAALGVAAADSAFAVQAGIDYGADRGVAEVVLTTQAGIGEIRYRSDGNEPDAQSPRYVAPLRVTLPAQLRANTFLAGRRIARARTFPLRREDAQLRRSRELRLCSDSIALVLEDDAPVAAARSAFALDIQAPCWIFPQADLSRVVAIEASVGQVTFNFQIGEAKEKISFPSPQTREGELEVRVDDCDGELLARLPLAPAAGSHAVTTLPRFALTPRQGHHDLCFRFAQPGLEPMWAIDALRLVEQ